MTNTTDVRASVEGQEHTLTLTVSGLPHVPNEFGGDAEVTRLRVAYRAEGDTQLHPTGVEFLDTTAQDGCFLAPDGWERPEGWPVWLRDFADRITPGRNRATPTDPAATVEHHGVKLQLAVADFPPIAGPNGQSLTVARIGLSYLNTKPTVIRFVLDNGTELFMPSAGLKQPQHWPQGLQRLVNTFRPAHCTT